MPGAEPGAFSLTLSLVHLHNQPDMLELLFPFHSQEVEGKLILSAQTLPSLLSITPVLAFIIMTVATQRGDPGW